MNEEFMSVILLINSHTLGLVHEFLPIKNPFYLFIFPNGFHDYQPLGKRTQRK